LAIARRHRVHRANELIGFVVSLAAPAVGLLGLVIGFTFSMSLTRFKTATLFKDYAKARVAPYGERVGSPEMMVRINKTLEGWSLFSEVSHMAALTRLLSLALVAALAACTPSIPPDAHTPPFAKVPYEPISRSSVVAVALREWRLFGSPVGDDPPGSRPPPAPDNKPEREEGMWQRVGEYWWLG
jgi:hypothetical protein